MEDGSTEELFILGHFALNDPYYTPTHLPQHYSPYYSPYDVICDVIGNPHYSASYPYVIVDLRGLGLELGLQLEG